MSVLNKSEKCVYLSHEKYINQLYSTNITTPYHINPNVFNVSTQFLRKNQLKSDEVTTPKSRKRKRKIMPQSTDENELIRQIEADYVEFKSCLIFDEQCNENNETHFVREFYNSSPNVPKMKGGNNSAATITARIEMNDYLIPPNCIFYNNDIRDIENYFNMTETFEFITLDPPWWNKAIRRLKNTVSCSGYNMIDNTDILNIPLEKLINQKTLVVVWCTNAKTHTEAIQQQFLLKWNCKLVTTLFWLKITKCGIPITEFREMGCKQPFERVIVACHKDRPIEDLLELLQLKLIVSVPSLVHSHKPPLLELFKPHLPPEPTLLEIFARTLAPKTTSIGLEVLKLQNTKLFLS